MASFVLLLALLPGAQAGLPPGSRAEQAASLLHSGKLSEARALYQAILQDNPADASAQQGEVNASERLALDARAHRDNDTALRVLLEAQSYVPANPKLLYDLGVLEDSMNLYADADETVARLQALPGLSDPKVLYLAARVKLDLGQLELAEREMRAYLTLSPEDASAHYGLGRILQLGQQLEPARAEFLRSVELRPQQTESYYQLGEIALIQAHYEDALTAFAKTLAGDHAHGGALTGTGIALFRLKDYEKAVASLTSAIAAAPAYQPAHYYLGLALARLGRKAESDFELARAAQLAAADNQHDSQRLRIQPVSPTQP